MSVGTQVPQQKGSLTIARLVEAVIRVAIRGEDGDLVSAALQPHGGVNHKALGTANAQVWVEEHNVLSLSFHLKVAFFAVGSCRPMQLSWGADVLTRSIEPCHVGHSYRLLSGT
jgi:hypothetical protein